MDQPGTVRWREGVWKIQRAGRNANLIRFVRVFVGETCAASRAETSCNMRGRGEGRRVTSDAETVICHRQPCCDGTAGGFAAGGAVADHAAHDLAGDLVAYGATEAAAILDLSLGHSADVADWRCPVMGCGVRDPTTVLFPVFILPQRGQDKDRKRKSWGLRPQTP